MVPCFGRSSDRHRADYEAIEGRSEIGLWRTFHYLWIIAIGLLCVGMVCVVLISLSDKPNQYDEMAKLQASANASLDLLSGFIAMPHISQADIERAYKEAVEEISSEGHGWKDTRRSEETIQQGHCTCVCGNVSVANCSSDCCVECDKGCHQEDERNSKYIVRAYQYVTYNVNDDFSDIFAEAKIVDRMTQIIARRFHLDRRQASAGLSSSFVGWNNCSRDCHNCTRNDNCSAQYRTFDGTCNNLKHQNWGIVGAAYRRVLPPDYGDGISSPRQSSVHGNGRELPSARAVSTRIHMAQKTTDDLDHNALMTFFGQFITHDISSTAAPTSHPPCNCGPLARNVPSCYPIDVTDDPFFSELNVTCLPFIRSQEFANPDCILGPREQVNLITSYLDGSAVYGSDTKLALELRSLKNGLMKTSRFHGEPLLPVNSSNPSSFCTQGSTNKLCFYAGDSRCNENLLLTSFHTIFIREHNRLSSELSKLNGNWTDERIFQEARRIVVAELQHITYGEYLPKLLGPELIAAHGLQLNKGDEYHNGYSEEIDPTIANEFSTAVFRFGHSMVRGVAKLLNSSDSDFVQLHKGLYTPWRFQQSKDTLASLLFGSSRQNPFFVSPHYSTELGNHLFQGEGDHHGLDLASITVQRGRDHGIPSYNAFRKFCGQSSLHSNQSLEHLFGKEIAQRFLNLYESIDDIDLCSGGLAEPHVPGGILGPTYACIVADQFSRLRNGDRFWYENGPIDNREPFGVVTTPFTREQLAEIRKTSLARIVCNNVPVIENLQPDLFAAISPMNNPVSCTDSRRIPRLNIDYWKTR